MLKTDEWKSFRVGDFFDIHPTLASGYTNATLFDGGKTPVVVNSAYNNGIGGYTTLKPTEKGNKITFSDTVDANTIFYQADDFVGYPHVQGLYTKDIYKDFWTRETLLFFMACFRKSALKKRFNYGNKFRRDVAINLYVLLPSKNGEPNWEYMKKYILDLEIKTKKMNTLLLEIAYKKEQMNIIGWKKFHLYDENLFEIDMGSKIDKNKTTSSSHSTIAYIGRSNRNNGVISLVDKIENVVPYSAGYLTLSLGGNIGSCFVQDNPFYTSQNVIVLKPKCNISFFAKQFIATVIFKETQTRYKAFIDELNRHIKTDFSFYLPYTDDGKPHFNYMDCYMRYIQKKTKQIVENLF